MSSGCHPGRSGHDPHLLHLGGKGRNEERGGGDKKSSPYAGTRTYYITHAPDRSSRFLV